MSKSYSIHDLSDYLIAPAHEYYAWLTESPDGVQRRLQDHPRLGHVIPKMVELLPENGIWRESRKILVRGGQIEPHTHPEWVALFYIDLGSPPLPVTIEGEKVLPKAGDCIVLQPNVWHHTEICESSRPRVVSTVMMEVAGNV